MNDLQERIKFLNWGLIVLKYHHLVTWLYVKPPNGCTLITICTLWYTETFSGLTHQCSLKLIHRTAHMAATVYSNLLCASRYIILLNKRHMFSHDWTGFYKKVSECVSHTSPPGTPTGCPRRNVPDFGRVFLMLKYTDITQNTYVQSWMVTEIMASEVWNFDSCYTLIDYQIHIKTDRNMWFL